MKRAVLIVIVLSLLLASAMLTTASGELAATLEVLSEGVEVQRVNTTNWIPVSVEAIVGVGDTIRTTETGRARITFFADGTDTELQPNTEYRILQFEGDENSFQIGVEVLTGQTIQRLSRLLDASSSYNVLTPGIQMVARGTTFAVRVEPASDRSAMIVTDGTVGAEGQATSADVPPGFGIRAEKEGALSDVVQATSFDELDAALDGCTVQVTTPDDVRLNVRLSPGLDAPRVGTIDASDVTTFLGVTESGGWYRIAYRDGFGWVLSSTAQVSNGCAGLRQFPDTYGPEDPALFSSLGDAVQLEDLPTPSSPADTATATP